jgi:hypothetical protein
MRTPYFKPVSEQRLRLLLKVHRRVPLIFSLILIMLSHPFLRLANGNDYLTSDLDASIEHLAEQMDRYHKAFDVYTDAGAAGNHFVALAKIGDDLRSVEINPCNRESVNTGSTAVKNVFHNTTSQNFGGVFFLNGVLSGQDSQPGLNFGDVPDAGVDLTGATQLVFHAKGATGGEQVEFFMGGAGHRPEDNSPVAPFPDSTPRVPSAGTLFNLSKEWTRYTIDLTGVDLRYVLNGFGWVCSAQQNPQGAIFWIDDIQYNKARLDEPRFIQSYVTLPLQTFDDLNRNAAYIYDNALSMLAFMSRGTADDWRRAKLIADAFVYAQAHDRFYTDGRLRNAYQAGDLILPPGWKPNARSGVARIPTILDCERNSSFEDRFQVGAQTGNISWVIIALLAFYQKMGGLSYIEAARSMGEWIEGRRQNVGFGGYRAGFQGFENPTAEFPNDPVELSAASTEHNLAVFVAFSRIFQATGDSLWNERASHARDFVDLVWDNNIDCFLAGATDAARLDRNVLPVDAQSLSVLSLPDALSRFPSVIECAEKSHRNRANQFTGFDFNEDKDGIWFEGTAQMVLAYKKAGDSSKANDFITELRAAQTSAVNNNGQGLVAASRDGVTTGFSDDFGNQVVLFNRLHIAATAWHVFAQSGINPYYLFASTAPKITDVSRKGKKLFVSGQNFDAGAVILINGRRQKTSNDEQSPTTKLIGKKVGKIIMLGDLIKVMNSDGTESNEFPYPAR